MVRAFLCVNRLYSADLSGHQLYLDAMRMECRPGKYSCYNAMG